MIEKIYWERINLCLYFKKNIDKKNILLSNGQNSIELLNRENKCLKINVTNTPEGKMLDRGNWYILIDGEKTTIDKKNIEILQDKSRIFKYRNGFYTYIVSLETNDELELVINIEFYMVNRKYKKYLRLIEGDNLKKKLFILFKIVAIFSINILYKIMNIFKTSKARVLFLYENGNELGSNLKSLYNYFQKEEIKCQQFSIDRFENKKNIKSFLQELLLMARSNIIIIENYTPILNIIKISRNTKLVQLWHAGAGFKSVGYARFGLINSPHPYHSSHRMYDLVIVDKENLIEVYQEVFGIKRDKIKPYGMPRLDGYLEINNIQSAKDKLNAYKNGITNKKIILFAPTYRGEGQEEAYYDYNQIDLKKIYEFCLDNDFLFIIKMHPFIKNKIEIPDSFQEHILDFSNLNINELIYFSDILITDYSSCVYEFSLFNRPIIFYRYDKLEYEYSRPVHPKDYFSREYDEVYNFKECLKILNKYKDISIKNRFKNIKNIKKVNSCDIIKKEVI